MASTAPAVFRCPHFDGFMKAVHVTAEVDGAPVVSDRVTLTVQAELFGQADRQEAQKTPGYVDITDPATGQVHRCPASVGIDTDTGDWLRADLWVVVPANLKPVWAVPGWRWIDGPRPDADWAPNHYIVAWPANLVADQPAVFRLVVVPSQATCHEDEITAGILDRPSTNDATAGPGYPNYSYGESGLAVLVGDRGRPGWVGKQYHSAPPGACTPTAEPTPAPSATMTPTPTPIAASGAARSNRIR